MDKEKISEELKTEVHKYWHKNIKLEPKIILTEEQLMEIAIHFANWQQKMIIREIIKSGTTKVTPFSVSKQKRKNIKEGKGPFDDGLAYVRKLTEVMNQKFLEADMPDNPEQAWELGFKTGANCQQEIEAKYREENNICCMKFDYIEEARLAAYEEGKNVMMHQMMKETVTTVYLEQICDQLSEAISLKKGHKVAAIIDMETDPHKILGWCLARVDSDGKLVMDKVGVFKTIMELLKRKKQ